MRPRRNQLSGVTLLLLMCWGAFITPLQSAAQTCTGTLQTVTQTQTFTTNGSGTVSPSFTKYSPPAGYSLMSAVLTSNLTIKASMVLTNTTTADITSVKASVYDEDVLQLNGSDITDINGNDVSDIATATKFFPAVTVPANGSVTVGPSTLFNNVSLINITLNTDNGLLNSFVGSGNVNLTYANSTGFGSSTTVSGLTPTFQVTTSFSLTYNYCYTGTLALDIVSFTATRENDREIALNWIAANEHSGRKYIVEMSSGDGNDFSELTTQPSDPVNTDASYSYNYMIANTDKGKLYFRLKLVEVDGMTAYSPLRIIDLGTSPASGFSIYHNPPSDVLNLLFPATTQGWQVDILTADGSLVQRNYYNNTNSGRLNFQRVLAAGTYFARATDLQTARNYVASFVIH